MTNSSRHEPSHSVNFADPRPFQESFYKDVKESLFPDDPFKQFKEEKTSWSRTKAGLKYFVPIFDWLPFYNLNLFKYDLLAGITIASLAIPQGISYAKLANIPPIIGLYSSFVPPLIYAVFGCSRHLAVGTVAASSLLIAATLGEKVSATKNPKLYLDLVFTSTFVTGVVEVAMAVLRLGILVDFLSHSTIVGFMGGTATIICLQQLKGIFGLKHFTSKTDVVSVLTSVFHYRKEWRWESGVLGVIFLTFLQLTRYVKQKKPNLFWVSAIGPIIVVVVGCIFAYLIDAEKYGIQIVGDLKKGLNPISIQRLNFSPEYISAPIRAGFITAMIALAEGIAIGRSFATMNNLQIDGNKEMLAFGLMNIVGSFTSCYLTTGPFSKTAVNYNAGCRTAMSNVVMAILMMLTLLFLAPVFSYTPLVALSAIIMSAMLSLIDYEKAYHLFKVDKFDFLICIIGFIGVAFVSMDIGLCLSIGLALIRSLLYIARPATCKLGNVPNSNLYRDVEQYPDATGIPGFLILQLGSPIYFANCNYIRERILRWVRDEQSQENVIEHMLLDLGGVSVIDVSGVETLQEIIKVMEGKKIKVALVNPRIDVLEKLTLMEFTEKIGKENIFFSVEDAIEAFRFTLKEV